MIITRRGAVSLLVLSLILVVGWLVYAPALSGGWHFDDRLNLRALEDVHDGLSALLFIFSGDAGPLGRPVALATFAAQAGAWGSPPAPFLAVNVLIHLFNAAVLAWILYALSGRARMPEERRWFVALAAAAVWLFMPLLASASLIVVQRMTTLSASFMLLALLGYLRARAGMNHAPRRSLVLMSTCLVAGTVLATLTKETGALLPVYVLVLEATLLPVPESPGRRWPAWKAVFLVIPTVLILGYVVSRVPYAPELVLRRDFNGWERLLTETRILWQYLFNAFVPQPGNFGPFHDGYQPVRTILDPVTMAAAAAWCGLTAAALLRRRRYPLFSFAVLWFLAGHVLESTLLSLELYFEHRNYLPIIGPVFALCAALMRLEDPRQKLAYAGISAYALVSALVLFTHTTLWGDPPAAARYWQEHFPNSIRAASTVASYRMASDGVAGTLESLHRALEENPSAGFLRVPELSLQCAVLPDADHSAAVAGLEAALRHSLFTYTLGTMLSELLTTATRTGCNGVDAATVRELARTVLENPRYAGSPMYRRLHHQLMAATYRYEGEYEQALHHLELAKDYSPSTELNTMFVTTYADAGDLEGAREFIEDARKESPWQPVRRYVWSTRLDELSRYIEALSARNASYGEMQLPEVSAGNDET